jgi:putative hemolysin
VTYVLVIIGELVPKYVTLHHAEVVALLFIRPLHFFMTLLHPLVWLVQRSGSLLLRSMGIKMDKFGATALTKEELMLLVKDGSSEGMLEEEHVQMISKALRFDQLDASDIMVHRLDVKWIDKNTPKEQLFEKVAEASHNRIPVCDGDIDYLVGILYLPDLIKHWGDPDFKLEKILRPVEVVPENLPLSRVLARMQDTQTQILIVLDEYGGTSGLLTLEDVIEEVFGEFEDQLEKERPMIEWQHPHRVSARANVRYDELLEFLHVEPEEEPSTDTLANMIIEALGRMPRLGDAIETPIGTIRVENMARRRITRVSIQLAPEIRGPEPGGTDAKSS